MGKLDEQLIQLINNEIEGKGGGFEEFCTLASEVVQPVVKKVFPKNETLYKKAVKQILVRMYQKIEMADMNQIREWMERFALDVLEKNYPRETAAAKKRETRQEQEPVKNEESLQKSARTEEQEQDELIAAAMAAFAKLQDDQPEEQVELPEEVQSFFEPEQPKEQDLQDTQELQIEITQPAGQQQETADISQTGPAAQKSDENPAGQTAQESEELSMEDDETEDIEGFSLESDGDEDDGDEFEFLERPQQCKKNTHCCHSVCNSSYRCCGTVSRRKKETAGIGESQYVNHGKTDRNNNCKHTGAAVLTDTDSTVRNTGTDGTDDSTSNGRTDDKKDAGINKEQHNNTADTKTGQH